jgi:signal transduction histidine kinase
MRFIMTKHEYELALHKCMQKLQRQSAKATALEQELSNTHSMMLVAAHEIKNPLQSIFLITDLLRRSLTEMLDTKSQARFESLGNAGTRIKTIIEDILENTGRALTSSHLTLEKLDLPLKLQTVLDSYTETMTKKQLRFTVTYETSRRFVKADRLGLLQSLDNLISNAVKFSPAGETIAIRVYERRQYLSVDIINRGATVSPAELHRLFQPFVKLSVKPTGGESTSGLGLWIVSKFMAAMNGVVRCDVEPNRHTVFTIEFKKWASR